MPTDPNIELFLDSYKECAQKAADKVAGGKHYFLEFPEQLKTDPESFVADATHLYRDVLMKEGLAQDPRDMISLGNSYYFIKSIVKAHRMYKRARTTNTTISLSDYKGTSEANGFVENMRLVGTVSVSPMIGGKKA